MAKVTLDMETFKALASSTRLQVLRALDERRKTLSELSKELDLNKATVHEHMQILIATGLVKKRDDEGRKWIYYELTWQGERILHPQETTTFAVLLGLGAAAAGGGVLMLGRALEWWMVEKQMASDGVGDERDVGAMNAPEASDDEAGSSDAPAYDQKGGSQEELRTGEGGAAAEQDSGSAWSDFFDSDDPEGLFAVLMFVTAVLLVAFGYMVRRHRRPV